MAKIKKEAGASRFRALVLIGVAAAFCAAVIPHFTRPSVASKLAEAEHPVACPPQWLPVLLAFTSPHDENPTPPFDGGLARATSGAEGRGPRPRATLAIGVMSAPGDSSRRGYIRPSLHRACASDTGLAFRFVLGLRGVSSTMVVSTVAENATFGDLLGLSAARDGGRQYFAEKTLAWLRYAGRAFPLADFIGKVDQDTYFVWNRARHLLDLALWQAGDRPLYVGQMEWASFLPEERRVCGCCGYTRKHGAYLQSQMGARFGSCGPEKSANTVAGPFPFAQGAFYALSRAALETGILRSNEADETQAALASDRWRNGDAEDIMVGFLLSRSVPDLLILHWGLTIFHNFDEGGLPRKYHQIEKACLDRHAILPSQLTTGEFSRWGTAETIGPMSAVVHRVVDAQQWARADVLVAQWSRMLQHRGHPDCFYPNGTVTLAAGSEGSRRVGQHRGRPRWRRRRRRGGDVAQLQGAE